MSIYPELNNISTIILVRELDRRLYEYQAVPKTRDDFFETIHQHEDVDCIDLLKVTLDNLLGAYATIVVNRVIERDKEEE
jgi:hypothetical protein